MNEPYANPDFWNPRYESRQTPWDFGGVPAATQSWLQAHPRGGAVLIPGCGLGHEITAFAAAGYDVTALDFSPAAVDRVRRRLGAPLDRNVVCGDFFTQEFAPASFDVIYERTFLCALPPALWPRFAGRAAALLKPRGGLIGHYFFGEKDDGPPFGLDPGEDERLFGAQFTRLADQPASDSLPLFVGRERWQERRRR